MSDVLLSVSPLVDELTQQSAEMLRSLDRSPRMAILRAVDLPSAQSLERQLLAACKEIGVEPWSMELPSFVPPDILSRAVHQVGSDPSIDGIALLCPEQYDRSLFGAAMGDYKDIGGLRRATDARFLPCFDSAVLRILDHYAIDCDGKTVAITDYSDAVHFILKNILSMRGATVLPVPAVSPETADVCRSASILFVAGDPAVLKASSCLSGRPVLISIGVDRYGGALFSSDWIQDLAPQCSALFPVPDGIDRLIPYIYAYNTVFSAQNR